MKVVFVALSLAAFASWLLAAVSYVCALGHRAPGVSLGSLLLNGLKAFDPSSFSAQGQRHQRRFLLGFGLFFVCLFAVVGLAVLSGS